MLHYLILDSDENIIASFPDGICQDAMRYAFEHGGMVRVVDSWFSYAPCQIYGYRSILNGQHFTPAYPVIR
jgi:hypothetical protein